ncbi:MAG: hypothetical protein AB4426_01490 [Xenococcaceae cyanobacterium]
MATSRCSLNKVLSGLKILTATTSSLLAYGCHCLQVAVSGQSYLEEELEYWEEQEDF